VDATGHLVVDFQRGALLRDFADFLGKRSFEAARAGTEI
jgi:hypothetical protein